MEDKDNQVRLQLPKNRDSRLCGSLEIDLSQAADRIARHNKMASENQKIYMLDPNSGEPQEIKIPTDEEFQAHHEKCFLEMPAELRSKTIQFLREQLDQSMKSQMVLDFRRAYGKATWFIGNHSYFGRFLRNMLRTDLGILDQELPTGNWDDYYLACLEAAIGVREVKTDA